MEEVRRLVLLECLERHGGNRTHAARELDVDVKTVYLWMKKEENYGGN